MIDGNADQNLEALEDEAGERLDVFLARRLHVSRGRAQKLLQEVTLNGSPAKASHLLRCGDIVVLPPHDEPIEPVQRDFSATEEELPPILWEDEHLLVINKPRGLTVHPGAGSEEATLVDILRAHGTLLSGVGAPERAGIVHRLDKDTSGVMIVCKTDEAHWQLIKDFESRRVKKTYSAIVCGVPAARGRIEAPIGRHATNRQKMAIMAQGRPATTEYSISRAWPQFALLDVHPVTGRTHQIRVHLAHLHHPIVGDERYGGSKRALQAAPTPGVRLAIEALGGQALHAARLELKHPVSGEPLSFAAFLPPVIQQLIAALDEATK